jgi:hypothetical protein
MAFGWSAQSACLTGRDESSDLIDSDGAYAPRGPHLVLEATPRIELGREVLQQGSGPSWPLGGSRCRSAASCLFRSGASYLRFRSATSAAVANSWSPTTSAPADGSGVTTEMSVTARTRVAPPRFAGRFGYQPEPVRIERPRSFAQRNLGRSGPTRIAGGVGVDPEASRHSDRLAEVPADEEALTFGSFHGQPVIRVAGKGNLLAHSDRRLRPNGHKRIFMKLP